MATNYPGSLDSFSRPSSSTLMDASGYEGDVVIDNLYDAVEAIETELGTNPAYGASSVSARLDHLGMGINFLWPDDAQRIGLGTRNTTNLTVTANRLYYTACYIPTTAVSTYVGLRVSTAATGNVRMGIYSASIGSTRGLVPDSLVKDCGTASTGSVAYLQIGTIGQSLSGGRWYFLAAVFDATPGVDGMTGAESLVHSADYAMPCFYQSHTYGALPSSVGTLTRIAGYSEIAPMMWTER